MRAIGLQFSFCNDFISNAGLRTGFFSAPQSSVFCKCLYEIVVCFYINKINQWNHLSLDFSLGECLDYKINFLTCVFVVFFWCGGSLKANTSPPPTVSTVWTLLLSQPQPRAGRWFCPDYLKQVVIYPWTRIRGTFSKDGTQTVTIL